ncbi:MAG: hypothetical protein AB7N91_28305 [Candidatus Tectimicrobiota bacterium]
MPAISATHELIDHVTTPGQTQHKAPSVWYTLARTLRGYLTPTSQARQTPACQIPQPFELPMDRMSREYPALSRAALAII